MKRPSVLISDPHPASTAALELLRRELAKQERKEWLDFREKFLREHDLVCHYCGKANLKVEIEDMSSAAQRSILATIDHVIPISKGGKRLDPNNCVVACYPCNSKKKDNLWV